jgi:hypothetical protein
MGEAPTPLSRGEIPVAFEVKATDGNGKSIVFLHLRGPNPGKQKQPKRHYSEKRERTRELIEKGVRVDEAARLAGYSEHTIKNNLKQILASIVPDAVIPHLRSLAAIGNFRAMLKADELLDHQDPKWVAYGAKILTENAKIHLTKNDTPTQIHFSFQTNVQFNQTGPRKSGPREDE